MGKITGLFLSIIAALFLVSATGCGKSEDKSATTSEKIGEAVKSVGEEAGQTMEKAGDAMKEAGEAVEGAAKEAADKMKEEKK